MDNIGVLILHFLFHLLIHLHFMYLERLKMHSFHKLTMLILELIKYGEVGVLSSPQSIACLPFSQNLNNKGRTKQWKRTKNKKNEEPLDLAYGLAVQTMRFRVSSFILFRPISFPSKIMPCKLNRNLNCLGPRPSSKGLGTNLKFLTNNNVRFHWTLLLGPLFNMTLKLGTCSCEPRHITL